MRTLSRMLIGLSAVLLVSCSSGGISHDASTAPLAEEVRRATQRYQDVTAATAAGYALFLGCVSSPQGGAMGIHYVNGDLVGDGKLDASRPEALMYKPKGGKLELVGVEYIVIAAAWDAANKTPPTLMGQLFHYSPSPNRYGIPPTTPCTSGPGGTTPPGSSGTGTRRYRAMATLPRRLAEPQR